MNRPMAQMTRDSLKKRTALWVTRGSGF